MKVRQPTTEESRIIGDALLGARRVRPYYGRAISALKPCIVDGIQTVAVDYNWRLYVDMGWFSRLPLAQQAAVIGGHEVEHLLRRHNRMDGLASNEVVNIAGDAEINDDLFDLTLPDGAVYPSTLGAPDNLLAEEYIPYLSGKSRPISVGFCSGGSGAGVPLPFELPAGPSWDEDQNSQIIEATALDVRRYAQTKPGSVPQNIVVWADSIIPPIPPRNWRLDLAHIVKSQVSRVARGRDDYSYGKVHRRWRRGQPLRPGMVAYLPKVGLAVDTSGSMGPEAVSVAMSVARAFGEVRTVQGDVKVTGEHTGALPKEWKGGGGTDMGALISALDQTCDVMIVITDGDTPWPDKAPSSPVIVALTAGEREVPEWAESITVV